MTHPFFSPYRFEAEVFDCEVEGEVPREIRGAFYRACTDRLYPARYPNDAVFNEDGAIDVFRFEDGHVDFKTRYVRTERFEAERAARKALFGLYRNRSTSDPSVQHLSMNTANTNLAWHGGKLLVLKESDPPIAIDPDTLETLGKWDFGGKLTSLTFTAHPKIDTATGEMIAFGYQATGDLSDDVAVYWIDASGEISREFWFKAPAISMMHDMALSQRHILIPLTSFRSNAERLASAEQHWAWEEGAETYVAVIDRQRPDEVRWFSGRPCAMVHTINAIDVNGSILLDAPVSPGNPFPWVPSADGKPFDPQAAQCTIQRWTFDAHSNSATWKVEELFPDYRTPGGLARMDDRFAGKPFRYSYMGYCDPDDPFDAAAAHGNPGRVTNRYGCFDHAERSVRSFFAGETHSLQEPCFVPRSPDAPEGDGWLIGVASNFAELRSELVILDALNPEVGAVARVKLPFRLHPQVHGVWVANA